MRRFFLRGQAILVRLTTAGRVGLCLLLIGVCTSCQKDTANPPTARSCKPTVAASPNPTVAVPSTPVDEDARAEPPADEDDADPLAGMDPELLAQLAEAEAAAAAEEQAGACGTCHVDVADDFQGSLHQSEEVGCMECHGPSEGHVEDENNEVKPDEVFARADVDRLCGECHKCPDPAAKRKPGPGAKHKVCTDCHGPHKQEPLAVLPGDCPSQSSENRAASACPLQDGP